MELDYRRFTEQYIGIREDDSTSAVQRIKDLKLLPSS